MLASHNTLTYLAPRRRWARLFRRYWQRQTRTAEQQIAVGAKRLDIRIRRTSRGFWRPCHGIIDLGDCDYPSLRALLRYGCGIYPADDLSFRVVLERSSDPEADTHYLKQEVAYASLDGYAIAEAAIKRPWQWLIRDNTTPAEDNYAKPIDTARPWWRQLPAILRFILNPRPDTTIPTEHVTDPLTLHYHDFI